MVVWDLPAISKGFSSLQSSRLSAIYNEVAPSLSVFGMLFGKALQAQVRETDLHGDIRWQQSHRATACEVLEGTQQMDGTFLHDFLRHSGVSEGLAPCVE